MFKVVVVVVVHVVIAVVRVVVVEERRLCMNGRGWDPGGKPPTPLPANATGTFSSHRLSIAIS